MANEDNGFRIESDSVGELPVKSHAYYGVQSLRASLNFPITHQTIHPALVANLARVKKACARTNIQVGELDPKLGRAIIAACDEILNGYWQSEFIVDAIQGGAGTSANMNANEVIANRAIEILGGTKGDYALVHPNDHVNRSQSTNDVFPTAGRLAVIELMKPLIDVLDHLIQVLDRKAEEFHTTYKLARTQLQDAVPMRLGQTFSSIASALRRDIKKTREAEKSLYVVNLGGTAIGTGINAPEAFRLNVVKELSQVCGIELSQAKNLMDATQNLDDFIGISAALKSIAVTLNKCANDLRLMSSGPKGGLGEINLPAVQSGSSIMPGKVNPVIPEAVNQVAFNVMGNDVTITLAASNGQLELNAFEPVLFYNIFESIDTMTNIISIFADQCISGITANLDVLEKDLENSTYLATVLAPVIGYQKGTSLAKKSIATGIPLRKLILEDGVLAEDELNELGDLDKFC